MQAAIMQPTYLPWIGYLAMIDRVDSFVFLDNVAFNDRSWQQRNYIRAGGDKLMLTVPVLKKGRRGQLIRDVALTPDGAFPEGHIRSIEMAYAKAPFYDACAPALFEIMRRERGRLCELTIAIVRWLMDAFGIATPTLRASAMDVDGAKAGLLVDICRAIGADRYLSAPGSREYIEDSDVFAEADIAVAYHDYEHPEYSQAGRGFVPYLGSIDLLFNEGGEAGLRILRSGVRAQGGAA